MTDDFLSPDDHTAPGGDDEPDVGLDPQREDDDEADGPAPPADHLQHP